MIRVSIDGSVYHRNSGGGIDRYFTETMRHLASEPELDIRCLLYPGSPRPLQDRGCVQFAYRNPSSRTLDAWPTRSWQTRIFHSSYYTPPPRAQHPHVVTVYDFIDHKIPAAAANPGSFFDTQCDLIRSASAVLTISQSTRDEILAHTGIPADRITVAYPGVASVFRAPLAQSLIDKFRQSSARGRPYWLYVGQRNTYKNFATLLEAFLHLAADTDTQLVVIGGHARLAEHHVEQLISRRCEDRVTLLRGVDDVTLKAAYSGALAFIQPSLAEGFGITLAEAMSCGTPLVVSDIPVFHEVAGDYATYFDPHDSEALAHELRRVLASSPPSHVRKAASDSAISRFDWRETARQWMSLYRQLGSA